MSNDASVHSYIRFRKTLGKVIAVSGGKGGTGKTNVSVNLAIALAQRQQQVVVLDADIGLANAEVVMGLKSHQTLQLVIEGKKRISEILAVGPNGVKIVPGVSGLSHLPNLDVGGRHNLKLAIEELQTQFDYVIIDTMAGIGPSSVAFSVAADEVLLVTTPEPSALVCGYVMIKAIHNLNPKARISVVANMADDRQQALRAVNHIAAAARKFLNMPLNYAGYIPRDQNVRQAVLQSIPFAMLYPMAPASLAMREIAATVLNEPVPQESGVRTGFFRRFAQTLGIAQ